MKEKDSVIAKVMQLADEAKKMNDIAVELDKQCDGLRNEFEIERDEARKQIINKRLYEIQQLLDGFKSYEMDLRKRAIELSQYYSKDDGQE